MSGRRRSAHRRGPRGGWACPRSASSSSSLALGRALEGRETVAPEDVQVRTQPFDAILARAIETVPSRASHAEQARVTKYAQMLRYGRPGDSRESRRYFDDGQLLRADESQDLAPVRLGAGPQGEVGAQDYSRNGCGRPDSTDGLSLPTTWPQV